MQSTMQSHDLPTIADAKFFLELQRTALGNPPVMSVECGLCEDQRSVMVYFHLGYECECSVDALPIAACFDLGRTISAEEFGGLHERIMYQFQNFKQTTRH